MCTKYLKYQFQPSQLWWLHPERRLLKSLYCPLWKTAEVTLQSSSISWGGVGRGRECSDDSSPNSKVEMALVILEKLIRQLANPVEGLQPTRRDFQQENGSVVVPDLENQGSDVTVQSHLSPGPVPLLEPRERKIIFLQTVESSS